MVGAVIGAGFASGREIATFFGPLSEHATYGALTSSLTMALGGGAIAMAARRAAAGDYGSVMRATAGQRFGSLLDAMLTGFLYLTAAVTLAGGATLLHQHYEVPYAPALGLTTALGSAITLRGARGLLRASGWLVAPLLAALVAIVVASLLSGQSAPTAPPRIPARLAAAVGAYPHGVAATPSHVETPPARSAGGHEGATTGARGPLAALAAGLLYASLNLILAAGVIAAAARYEDPRAAVHGSACAGAGLGLLAALLLRAIQHGGPEIVSAPLPMAALAARLGQWGLHCYAIALYLAVLTTVAAATASLAERTRRPATAPVYLVLAAVPAGLGFARLVQLVYPPMGLLGLVWLWRLLCVPPGRNG
jgi:uncharacterized membrane protein YkvI